MTAWVNLLIAIAIAIPFLLVLLNIIRYNPIHPMG